MALGQFESTTDIHYERPDVMMMFTENCVTEKIFRLRGLDSVQVAQLVSAVGIAVSVARSF